MNCPKCATVLADGSPFCSTCGSNLTNMPGMGPGMPGMPGMPNMPGMQQNPYGMPGMPMMMEPSRTSGMAIAGFILALLSCSLLGFIFSIIGYNECKRSGGVVKGEGLAMAGIIISIVWFVGGLAYFASARSHY